MAHTTKKKLAARNFRKKPIPYARVEKTKQERLKQQETKYKNFNENERS